MQPSSAAALLWLQTEPAAFQLGARESKTVTPTGAAYYQQPIAQASKPHVLDSSLATDDFFLPLLVEVSSKPVMCFCRFKVKNGAFKLKSHEVKYETIDIQTFS